MLLSPLTHTHTHIHAQSRTHTIIDPVMHNSGVCVMSVQYCSGQDLSMKLIARKFSVDPESAKGSSNVIGLN